MRTQLFFAPLLFLSTVLVGQDNLVITGKIIDSKSGRPVPFATIQLITANKAFGVISNGDGDFQIPTRYRGLVDSIKISCIGYINRKIALRQLTDQQTNILTLTESIIQLSEVIVKARKEGKITAEKVVRTAIENISINYSITPHSYVAYYRDYQIEAKQYKNLNEAIVEIFDQGFGTDDLETDISLIAYEQNQEFQRDSTTEIAYDNEQEKKFIPGASLFSFGGNELAILRIHDALRNSNKFSFSFVNEFDKDFIKNHFFTIAEVVHLNEIPLYHITFNTKPNVTGYQHFAKGSIYIEVNNFAIHKLEYTTSEKRKSETKAIYNIQIEYARGVSGMMLNYISFNNYFLIKDPNNFEVVGILVNRYINAIVITFNKKPEKQSAMSTKNYNLKFDNKPLGISHIEISQDTIAYVVLAQPLPAASPADFGSRLGVDFKGIKDLDGREVNVIKHIPVNQFRELFTQTITSDEDGVPDSGYISKTEPLSHGRPRAGRSGLDKYWMNTPLKKE